MQVELKTLPRLDPLLVSGDTEDDRSHYSYEYPQT